jgi:hypothetical protein
MTTIQITLHDGTAIIAQVETFNSDEMAVRLNDPKLLMVSIGEVVVNKNAVKLIAPANTSV